MSDDGRFTTTKGARFSLGQMIGFACGLVCVGMAWPAQGAQYRIRACDTVGQFMNIAVGARYFDDVKLTWGWYTVSPNDCSTITSPAWKDSDIEIIYTFALDSGGHGYYRDYDDNDLDHNATFCTRRTADFGFLDVDQCHEGVAGFEFHNFGAVSFDSPNRLGFRDGRWFISPLDRH